MIKSILCPVDRSLDSLQAFAYAIALARWQGARLSLLEVIEVAPPPGANRASEDDNVPREARTALERDLRRMLVARHASDLRVKIFMRKGNVVQEILAQARASRCDLVVIGSHGRSGAQRLVLGSVAERVLRLATCPVLTVRRGVNLARRRGSPFRKILCPTDFSSTANKAVSYAKRLAKEADAKLIVTNAVAWPSSDAVPSGAAAELRKSAESEAREGLARLLPRSSSDQSQTEAVVAIGRASAAIIEVARARSVDLVVMGVSGRDAADPALLGSTTHQVIREGTWPVLTVRAVRTPRRSR
jgi:nucleotide-binding universal stress UspA family protein